MKRRTERPAPDYREHRHRWTDLIALTHQAIASQAPADLKTLGEKALDGENIWTPIAPFPGGLMGRVLTRLAYAYARQVDPARRVERERRGLGIAPGMAAWVQPEEGRDAGTAADIGAGRVQRLQVVVGQRLAVGIQHHQPGAGPQRGQRIRVVAQMVGAVERAIDEGERRGGAHAAPRVIGHAMPPSRAGIAQTVKLLPQPQVVLAFGLRITNCAPVSDSV
ncbi:MAG: hypothetical protein J0M21_00525 [Xanthomonadales bacterium]|nr:hypothetical protein [Xanthomonadales bacterium]